jgi:UDP-N-acetylglucosamine 2-epimerase (non-hydrolysing)
MKPKVAIILGIRPDVIRASKIIKIMKQDSRYETVFIWSGQHYSANLKDVFFRELNVPYPDIELNIQGESDSDLTASIVSKLAKVLIEIKPQATVFLGDTNTVIGCIAAAQLNIPILHIEGCMRSYDWRMPEEKNRILIDSIADVIYAYFSEYKDQGVREGIQENRIVVTQNLIVDILNEFFIPKRNRFKTLGKEHALALGIEGQFYLATIHRRENVESFSSLSNIFDLLAAAELPVIFPAGYRTQRKIREFGLEIPNNVKLIDPVGYFEFLSYIVSSNAVFTDSGTVVEETAVIGIPSIQLRKSTERPQTYDCLSSIKFEPDHSDVLQTISKLQKIKGTSWEHNLGDGKASIRIAQDIAERLLGLKPLMTHNREHYLVSTERSYMDDRINT